MKRKYREAMRAAARERDERPDADDDAIEARDWHEETAQRRTLWAPKPVEPCTGEPWRPVMTEQERQQHEQYVRENNLPF
jgi:hypothetical protein